MRYLVVPDNYVNDLLGRTQGIKLNKFLAVIENHKISNLLIVCLTELIYPAFATTISELQTQLGLPVTVLQLKSSYSGADYETITIEWCSHTGFIWENNFSHTFIPDQINRSHSNSYEYKSDDLKLLCMLGKVRYPNRVMFWDSLVSDGNLDNVSYSYYDLLPDTEAWHQQKHNISVLSYFMRSQPDTWPDLVNSLDFDLTSQVPGAAPGIGNLFHCGYPTHPDLYHNTVASIVPETTCERSQGVPFITEKTYRAIQNYHPFCVYGDPDSHEYLRIQGYETFDSEFGIQSDAGDIMATILGDPDRDQDSNIHSVELRLSSPHELVQRHRARKDLAKHINTVTEYFIDNYPDNYLILKAKCEHNRHQWLHVVSQEQQQLCEYFRGADLLDVCTNQPITNIIDFLYQYHHIYLQWPVK